MNFTPEFSTTFADITDFEETVPTWKKCLEPSPISSVLLQRLAELGSTAIGTMVVPPILMVIMSALFLDEMLYFLRQSLSSTRLVYYCWVLGTYPVLSLFHVLGLFVPKAYFVIDFAATFYFVIALKKYFGLILHYYGGKQQMVEALKGQKVVSANFFPCCFVCCCYKQPMTMQRINTMQVIAYQAIIILPTVYFIQSMLIAEGYGQTPEGVLGIGDRLNRSLDPPLTSGWHSPVTIARTRRLIHGLSLILATIGLLASASKFTGLYSYVVMAKASRIPLENFAIEVKYQSIQLVVAFDTLQSILFNILGRFDALPCGFPYPDKNTASIFHSYLFICELFILSIVAWFGFRRCEDDFKVIQTEVDPPSFDQVVENYYTSEMATGDNIATLMPGHYRNIDEKVSAANENLHIKHHEEVV